MISEHGIAVLIMKNIVNNYFHVNTIVHCQILAKLDTLTWVP